MEADNDHFLVRAMTDDSGYKYAVNEWPDEDGPKSVREAFQAEKAMLYIKLSNINLILASDSPEKAELLMSANADFKIWQLVVPTPQKRNIDFENLNQLINKTQP
jgi:hypothetical protein